MTSLGAYVLGALDDRERDRVDDHVAACARCRRELEALIPVRSYLAARVGGGAARARRRRSRRRRSRRGCAPPCAPSAGAPCGAAPRRWPALAAVVLAAVVALRSGEERPAGDRPRGRRRRRPWPPPTPAPASARPSRPRRARGAPSCASASSGAAPGERCRLIARARDGRTDVAATWWTTYSRHRRARPAPPRSPAPDLVALDVVTSRPARGSCASPWTSSQEEHHDPLTFPRRLRRGARRTRLVARRVRRTTTEQPAAAASGRPATVSVDQVDGVGAVLVDQTGAALYASDEEADGKVRCTADCLASGRRSRASGAPTAGDGVTGKLDTVERPDGTRRSRYDGKPLYSFSEDAARAGHRRRLQGRVRRRVVHVARGHDGGHVDRRVRRRPDLRLLSEQAERADAVAQGALLVLVDPACGRCRTRPGTPPGDGRRRARRRSPRRRTPARSPSAPPRRAHVRARSPQHRPRPGS